MYSKFHRLTLGVCLAALLLLPTASFGADPVKVTNYGDALVFEPQVEAHDMILTVTGPCNYELRRSLLDDRELVFQLDETTIDGRYRFQITVIPNIDRSVLDVLQQARKAGDNSEVDALCREGKLPGDPVVQVAGFGVIKNQIVYDPDSLEEKVLSENSPADFDVALADGGMSRPMSSVANKSGLDKQVISGDLTVYNSLCVGFDCLASESYGADTIRLKENNLRLHVEDTSTAASFPTTDWRLEFNSNANGGGSYFRVNDVSANRSIMTLEASAPSHSLYVDSGGRVGNGTSNPVTELHSANGDTPTLRLEQTTASGFAAQTWDIAGNETSFFIRDATNGSTLPFRIRPGASSNSLVIDSDNDVGIGILSPEEALHLRRTDANATNIKFDNTNAAAQNVNVRLENSAGSWDFRTNAGGNFAISKVGSGVFEFLINNATGEVSVDGNLSVGGDLNVTGTKNFAVPDPTDSKKWLYYSALEGPEAGTYYRGTGKLVEGEVVIELPESFAKLTEERGLTVQLTPLGGWHQLYVAEKSPTQLVVRDAEGGDGIEFDYFVQGVRKGYGDFQVERPAPEPVTESAD